MADCSRWVETGIPARVPGVRFSPLATSNTGRKVAPAYVLDEDRGDDDFDGGETLESLGLHMLDEPDTWEIEDDGALS